MPNAGHHAVTALAQQGLLARLVTQNVDELHRVEASFALVSRARLLLALGSSLRVVSGYRFVLRAATLGVPVAIINQGPTRGDPHAALTLNAPLGEALPQLFYAATGRTSPRRSPTRSPVRPARTALRPGPKT